MSRTDKDMPWQIQAMDAPRWMRTESHNWCENETIDTAHPSQRDGRAVYEKEFVKFVDVEIEFVKMIDANKVKFDAEIVKDWRRGKPGTLIYDREAHPFAQQYTYPYWYSQSWMQVRSFSKRIVAIPTYRSRLVGWEWEPRRECDIDKPFGVCYYRSNLYPSCYCCGRQGVAHAKRSSKRRTKARLDEMVHEYNTFGEVGDEPPPKYPADDWW